MTKKITWMLVLLFGISSVFVTCKKNENEGTTASTPTQADWIGNWNVSGGCGTYTMNSSLSGTTLTFKNFHSSFTVTATANGTNMTIPAQAQTSPSAGGPYTFSGSGSLTSPSNMTITYTVKDISGTPLNCSATATR